MKELAGILSKLLKYSDEYVSHSSALYFLGLSTVLPPEITIVSRRRRRNRIISDKLRLSFIYRKNSLPARITTLTIGEHSLAVSSFETTLVDILSGYCCSPPVEENAGLYCMNTISPIKLLKHAKEFSDASHKRCCFWLAWAGKITFKQIPQMTKTPVVLDPRLKSESAATEGRLSLKYPVRVLGIELTECGDDWANLRNNPHFRNFCIRHRWLPIKNDPRPRSKHYLERFHSETVISISSAEQNIVPLLASIANNRSEDDLPSHVSRLTINWAHQLKKPDHLFPWLKHWIEKHLDSYDARAFECAVYFAFKLKMVKKVINALNLRGSILDVEGRYDVLRYLCESLIADHKSLPAMIFAHLGRIMILLGNLDRAENLLTQARNSFNPEIDLLEEAISISFAFASLYMRRKQFAMAHSELKYAHKILQGQNKTAMMAGLYQMRGNLYYLQEKLGESRKSYLQARKLLIKCDQIKRLAGTLHNLAKIEELQGRYFRSRLYFAKSAKICRKLGLHHKLISTLSAQAAVLITLGKFKPAVKALTEAYELTTELNNVSATDKAEIMALLAWGLECSGQSAQARPYWQGLEDESFANKSFLALIFPALKEILNNRLNNACLLLKQLVAKTPGQSLKPEQMGRLMFLLGLCEHFLAQPQAPNSLLKARKLLSHLPDSSNKSLLEIFLWCIPQPGSKIDYPTESLKKINSNKSYTALWFFYAPALARSPTPESEHFIAHHLKTSTPGFIKHVAARNSEFSDFYQKYLHPSRKTPELTIFSPSGAEIINGSKYKQMQKSFGQTELVFDFVRPVIQLNGRQVSFRANSYPFRILRALLHGNLKPVALQDIHQSMWGRDYDPEIDKCAIQAAIYRLRQALSSFSPRVRVYEKKIGNLSHIAISISGKWLAFIPD